MTTAAPAPAVDVDALLDDLKLEVLELVANGECGCACGGRLPAGASRRRHYLNERHRQRAYRRRLELVAQALGVPARLSRQTLQTRNPTGNRHADAQTRRTAPQRRHSRPAPGVTLRVPTLAAANELLRELERLRQRMGVDPVIGTHADVLAAALERKRTRNRRARARA